MENISRISVLALPFAVVISVCHLEGYWGTFNVDIFSYLSISEIAVLAAVPLWKVGLVSAVGVLFAISIERGKEFSNEHKTTKTKVLKRCLQITEIVLVLLVFLSLFLGAQSMWKTIPMLVVIALGALVVFSGILKPLGDNAKRVFFASMALAILAGQIYGSGISDALRIIEGTEYKEAQNATLSELVTGKSSPRYIGKAGDQYFFFDPNTEEVLKVSSDTIKDLRIKHITTVTLEPSPKQES